MDSDIATAALYALPVREADSLFWKHRWLQIWHLALIIVPVLEFCVQAPY